MATFRSQRTDNSTLGEGALSNEQHDGTNVGTMRRRGGVLAVVVPCARTYRWPCVARPFNYAPALVLAPSQLLVLVF